MIGQRVGESQSTRPSEDGNRRLGKSDHGMLAQPISRRSQVPDMPGMVTNAELLLGHAPPAHRPTRTPGWRGTQNTYRLLTMMSLLAHPGFAAGRSIPG